MSRHDDMSVFVSVVDCGGFSRAADQLRVTPSAVSRIIGRLEHRLGARLLNRTTRHVGPTEEGRAYYARCQTILANIDEAERAVSGAHEAVRGTLRINASVPFATHQLVPLIPAFTKRHPAVSIDLTVSDRLVDLHEEGIDIAIRTGGEADPRYAVRTLAQSRRVVCAAPAYLEAHGTPKTPSDLTNHQCLTFNIREGLNTWPFRVNGKDVSIAASGAVSANNGDTLLQLACAGAGLMRVAEFMAAADIAAGRLVPLLDSFHPGDEQTIYALYIERGTPTARVRCFLDFLEEAFAPVPPWERR